MEPVTVSQWKIIESSNRLALGSESESRSGILTLCNPMDYTFHGIFQARVLEWVAFPFSRGSS